MTSSSSAAGQSGLATAFGLLRSQVDNILVLDKAPAGREGPWRSYARMHTLRSPKDFTGPDLDMPSLTYQSWHEANFGGESWHQLGLIPKSVWADYLDLVPRCRAASPCRNEAEVVDIAPAGDLLALTVRQAAARKRPCMPASSCSRPGQEGMGDWIAARAARGAAAAPARCARASPSISPGSKASALPSSAPAPRPSTMRRPRWRRARQACICSAAGRRRRWFSPIAG